MDTSLVCFAVTLSVIVTYFVFSGDVKKTSQSKGSTINDPKMDSTLTLLPLDATTENVDEFEIIWSDIIYCDLLHQDE